MRIALFLAPIFAITVAASAAPDTSPAAARRVVERYYAAIDKGAFRTAWLAWDQGGAASGKSYDAFRRGFASTAHSRVVTGTPTDGDAGMSQRWITVPVDVYATLKNGQRQHFRGTYTLHRVVAGVGASPSAMSWHISAAKLVAVR
ncbi:MAG: hypothetical protein V4459_00060 [Pseudomonadota bacterium]